MFKHIPLFGIFEQRYLEIFPPKLSGPRKKRIDQEVTILKDRPLRNNHAACVIWRIDLQSYNNALHAYYLAYGPAAI